MLTESKSGPNTRCLCTTGRFPIIVVGAAAQIACTAFVALRMRHTFSDAAFEEAGYSADTCDEKDYCEHPLSSLPVRLLREVRGGLLQGPAHACADAC